MAALLRFQSLSTRLAILACFWAAILLSIPSWLRLTTIQRLPLPTHDVERLHSSSSPCPITFHKSLSIRVDSGLLPSPAEEFLREVEALVGQSLALKADSSGGLECTQWEVKAGPLEKEGVEKGSTVIRVLSEGSVHTVGVEDDGIPTVLLPPTNSDSLPIVPDTVSAAAMAELLVLLGVEEGSTAEQDPRVIQFSKHIRLVFSIMNQDSSDSTPYDSALIHALTQNRSPDPINKLTKELGGVHDFHVETQVQWFAPLHFNPTTEVREVVVERDVMEEVMVEEVVEEVVEVPIEEGEIIVPELAAVEGEGGEEAEGRRRTKKVLQTRRISIPRIQKVIKQTRTPLPPRHIVEWDDLKVFVNSEQWALTSTVPPTTSFNSSFDVLSQTHDLHFLLYVPSRSHTPLLLRDATGEVREDSNAWLIPQWGGVVILNTETPTSNTTALSATLTCGGKGVSELPEEPVAEAITLFTRQLEILLGLNPSLTSRQARVEQLKQRRTLELAKETVSTLTAITRLVDQIPNLGVGAAVKQDTEAALAIMNSLRNSIDTEMDRLLGKVVEANSLSKRAFFNPDMLGLLYFPDEHKYAVYTPLFAPLLVPLFVTTIKLVREVASSASSGKKRGRKSS